MVVINPQYIASRDCVTPLRPDSVQQNGIDCSLKEVFHITDYSYIHNTGKRLPRYTKLKPNNKNYFHLQPGQAYLIELNESVQIPPNMCALFISRSTFNRHGCQVVGCVFDSGYKGIISLTMYPRIDTFVEVNTRVGQLLFLEAEPASLYNGQYQNKSMKDILVKEEDL